MTDSQAPQPAPTAHDLKTDPEVFDAVQHGDKTFEIRFNDRNFKVGDTLHLLKTVHTGAEMKAGAPLVYTCDEIVKTVSHILTGYGLAEGWCCLSFAPEPPTDEQAIELASALEVHRALRIVADVAALPIGGADVDMPTPLHAGYQLACEEIAERIRTEVHVLPGGLTLPGCGPLPSVRQPAAAIPAPEGGPAAIWHNAALGDFTARDPGDELGWTEYRAALAAQPQQSDPLPEPFHPDASHIEPGYRDGWNACYRAALAAQPPASHVEFAVRALVAAGYIAQAKADEAMQIARQVAPAPAEGDAAELARWLHAAYDRPPQTPEVRAMLAKADALAAAQPQPKGTLTVWYGPMPESNGKSNWTAILHRGDLSEGHTIGRSEYPDRVRYYADSVRYLIGELAERPDILAYDDTLHSGYVAPTATQAPAPAQRASCEYCDGTGDVHRADGEWLGECNQCPAAVLHAFKNFHRLLCERFGYGHDEKDWRRDQLSLIEFIAAKFPTPAVAPAPEGYRVLEDCVTVMPASWVPLRMEWEPGYPEDVAFGPVRMMERLKKWLDAHFAARQQAQYQASLPAWPAAATLTISVDGSTTTIDCDWGAAIRMLPPGAYPLHLSQPPVQGQS